MERELTIRGLPGALVRDAWWFGKDIAPPKVAEGADRAKPGGRRGIILLLALVLAGDFLFYGQDPGLSVVLFAGLVFAGATLGLRWNRVCFPLLLLIVAALPAIDYLQEISFVFLAAGLVISVAWARSGARSPAEIGHAARALAQALPFDGLRGAWQALRAGETQLGQGGAVATALHRVLRNWSFPLGGALVLATLLADANPVLSGWLSRVPSFDADLGAGLRRILFWSGVALLVWPFLTDRAPVVSAGGRRMLRLPGLGLNPVSVTNALLIFNIMMAVQTLLDLRYLWSGAALPEGLSHAEYAHRGAYPLLATALLAGAFALVARPFLDEGRHLRPLIFLWLGQNVLLTASAALRLRLYIEAYGLTYLRLHAGIWMALVACGLMLTGWQILRRRTNLWLLLRTSVLGLSVLYAAAFVNFAGIIAAQNLTRGIWADLDYVCMLGPLATPALAAEGVHLSCLPEGPVIRGWRDWGFREWRAARYLDAMTVPETIHEDPRRR